MYRCRNGCVESGLQGNCYRVSSSSAGRRSSSRTVRRPFRLWSRRRGWDEAAEILGEEAFDGQARELREVLGVTAEEQRLQIQLRNKFPACTQLQ